MIVEEIGLAIFPSGSLSYAIPACQCPDWYHVNQASCWYSSHLAVSRNFISPGSMTPRGHLEVVAGLRTSPRCGPTEVLTVGLSLGAAREEFQ